MTEQGPGHDDPRDVDAEFARMLEGEGMRLRPGEAPREPAATEHGSARTGSRQPPLRSFSADSPPEPPTEQSRARARAAHPSAGGIGPRGTDGIRAAPTPRGVDDDLDDDAVIYGDFEPPDPDLPQPSEGALWSWTALVGGFALLMLATFSSSVPGLVGWLGGAAAVGGVIALLLRVPREGRDDGDGAQV